MLKIWGRNTSINVQKVMWAIGELGIPHERIDVGGRVRPHQGAVLSGDESELAGARRWRRTTASSCGNRIRSCATSPPSMAPARSSPQTRRIAPAPANGWTGCSRSARRRSIRCSGDCPHAAGETGPRQDRRSARQDRCRTADARHAARQDRVRRRRQVLDGRYPGRADHLSLPQAGAGPARAWGSTISNAGSSASNSARRSRSRSCRCRLRELQSAGIMADALSTIAFGVAYMRAVISAISSGDV